MQQNAQRPTFLDMLEQVSRIKAQADASAYNKATIDNNRKLLALDIIKTKAGLEKDRASQESIYNSNQINSNITLSNAERGEAALREEALKDPRWTDFKKKTILGFQEANGYSKWSTEYFFKSPAGKEYLEKAFNEFTNKYYPSGVKDAQQAVDISSNRDGIPRYGNIFELLNTLE